MKIDAKLLAVGCLLLWSLSPPLAKIGVGQVGSLGFALLTGVFASIFALPFFISERGWVRARVYWKKVLAFAFISYFLFSILYFIGMNYVSAIQGSALLGTEVMFSLLLGVAFRKERARAGEMLFTLLLMLGVAIVVTNGALAVEAGFGSLLILAALFAVQLGYYVAADAIEACGVGTMVFFGFLLQAVGVFAVGMLTGSAIAYPAEFNSLLLILAYAALPGLGASLLYFEALKKLGVYVTTAIVVPAPAVAVFLSAFLLGEQLTLYQIMGIALIVLSIWKITEERKENK